jgi:hypothetical protein
VRDLAVGQHVRSHRRRAAAIAASRPVAAASSISTLKRRVERLAERRFCVAVGPAPQHELRRPRHSPSAPTSATIARSASCGTTSRPISRIVASTSSDADSATLARAEERLALRRALGGDARRALLGEREVLQRLRSAWRASTNSSTNTLTFARMISGTTGEPM